MADIVKRYLDLLCIVKSYYEAVENLIEVEDPPWRNEYFKEALGVI